MKRIHQNPRRQQFAPGWIESPPNQASYRAIFKWGAPDRFKHPNARLCQLLKECLGLDNESFQQPQKTGNQPVGRQRPISLSSDQVQQVVNLVGERNVAADDFNRLRYGTGKTAEEAWQLREGRPTPIPDLVVHPRNRDDIQALVAWCHAQRVPLYPYGGGSSVTFGVRPDLGGLSLVLATHMNRVRDFNEINQTITVEAGIMGPVYEDLLNRAPSTLGATRPFTGGHFPQSFEFSTVGGWIAALGSGQLSSYYGDMGDLVLAQEMVTPAGVFRTVPYPASATGPKVNDMLKGSEGAFGVLVSATLKIFRYAPQSRRRFAFMLPDWERAVAAAREVFQGEFGRPSLFRISDAEETEVALRLYGIEGGLADRLLQVRGLKSGRRCLLLGQADGATPLARVVQRQIGRICRRMGGMGLTGAPVKRWETGRFRDPYMREDLNDFGIVIDTLETSVGWDQLPGVYSAVRRHIKERPRTICMTHASHFYPQGTNLYFIFITPMGELADFQSFQRSIIERIQACGGSLSHHHGVGKLMGPWMERHLGRNQMDLLRTLKAFFDPCGIMNPGGTLGLDERGETNPDQRP